MRLTKKYARIVCALLMLSLLFLLPVNSVRSAGKKAEVHRTIAIVFDNSGSMYADGSADNPIPIDAWCNATYAMEVFASMMNEGDILQIYPMHEIRVGNESYSSSSPLVISRASDTQKIRNIVTKMAAGTPMATIDEAVTGLNKAPADHQKWLIVLTDGITFDSYNVKETRKVLGEKLTGYASSVNVMYLGIGDDIKAPTISGSNGNQTYTATGRGADVLKELTTMCNMIFGRNELNASANNLSFDLPMTKLIAFVQGKNLSGVYLTDSSGRQLNKVSEYMPHYSEKGCDSTKLWGPIVDKYDDSLQGVMVSYENLEPGTYVLNYSGDPQSSAIYYEPEVDLTAYLVGPDGNVCTDTSTLYPGTYTIQYGLVDKQGNFTQSDLLKNTYYSVAYRINGQERSSSSDRPGSVSIDMGPHDNLEFVKVSADYLDGYHIEKDGPQLGFPSGGFEILPRPAGTLELQISGGKDQYELEQLSSGVYELSLIYDGKSLSGTDLEKAILEISISGSGIGYDLERTGSGYRIKLKTADPSVKPEFGKYALEAKASYPNEDGQIAQSNVARKEFNLVPKPAGDLSLKISGGKKEYKLSELEEGIYHLELTYEGKALDPDQLSRVKIFPELTGGNAGVKAVLSGDGFDLQLQYAGSARDTDEGDYTLNAFAIYTNEDGQEATSNTVTENFHVENDGFGITMTVVKKQAHVELKKIDSAEPILVQIKNDGNPLTPEEFSKVRFSVTPKDGSKFFSTVEPLPEESAFAIHLDPQGDWKTGTQRFICKAEGTDPIGSPFSVEKENSVKIIPYPMWIRYAVIAGILLVIAALVWMFLNMKVLPKALAIEKGSEKFMIDATAIQGNAKLTFDGGGKKNGVISLKIPNASAYPLVKGGVSINVEAVDRRMDPSKKRRLHVFNQKTVAVSATNTAVMRIDVGTKPFKQDPVTLKMTPASGNPAAFWQKGFDIGNFTLYIQGTTVDDISFKYSCKVIRR